MKLVLYRQPCKWHISQRKVQQNLSTQEFIKLVTDYKVIAILYTSNYKLHMLVI